MDFDLIIRGGEVVDGTGAPARKVDIGIRGERIVAMGDLTPATAARDMDASGMVVAPGFIDTHSHSDAYLLLEPDAPSKITQGITTEVNGQCGGSGAPRLGAARISSDWASYSYPVLDDDGTTQINDKPGPTWSTVAEYRRLFEATQPAINTVQFIGHNTLRAGVTGYAPRVATDTETVEMCRRLERALDEGGHGLSTGFLYQPGKFAAQQEVEALARVTARYGGIYATHIRSEGTRLLESLNEVLELACATGVKTQISHLKTSGATNWHKLEDALATLNNARARGVVVHADRYPYTASGTDLDVVLPEWASAGGRDAILANLRDHIALRQIESELNNSQRDWSKVMLGGGWSETTRAFSGRTIAEAAAALGISPGAVVCRFIDADDTRTGAFFFGMCMENLRRIYEQPWVMVGSDASLRAPWGVLAKDHPHPRAYGSIPRFLRLMTGRESGFERVCDLPEAIRRLSSLPAQSFGLKDRGVLAKGAFADVVIFNAAEFRDNATYAKPHQFATGMRQVIVNGAISWSEGSFTGVRKGYFLERA